MSISHGVMWRRGVFLYTTNQNTPIFKSCALCRPQVPGRLVVVRGSPTLRSHPRGPRGLFTGPSVPRLYRYVHLSFFVFSRPPEDTCPPTAARSLIRGHVPSRLFYCPRPTCMILVVFCCSELSLHWGDCFSERGSHEQFDGLPAPGAPVRCVRQYGLSRPQCSFSACGARRLPFSFFFSMT